MNETAKHDDIEDVLSSIRRLVSDSSTTDRVQDATPAAERLVLTPAFRVADVDGNLAAATPAEKAPEEDLADRWMEDGQADDSALDAAESKENGVLRDDESWPERPVEDLNDMDVEDDGSEGNLEVLAPRETNHFGLSSFTDSFSENAAFQDTRDVVMFRGADAQAEEIDGPEVAPEDTGSTDEETSTVSVEGEAEQFALDEEHEPQAEDGDVIGALQLVENTDQIAADTPSVEEPSAVEHGWPAPDEEQDAPVTDEPETWLLGENSHAGAEDYDALSAAEDELSQTAEVQAFEGSIDVSDIAAADEATVPADAPQHMDEAPEDFAGGDDVSSIEDAGTPSFLNAEVVDEAAFSEDPAPEVHFPEAEFAEADEVDGHEVDPVAALDPIVEDVSDDDEDVTDDISGVEVETEHANEAPRAALGLELDAFEPEHGDTDWSETESVQPALDIAAVRHARGEEVAPDPDAAPAALPVFARSRRRPMTSLDDLITPEDETDTVADAVSQALADNALDRAEGGIPEEDETQAAAAAGKPATISDAEFDITGVPGDDLDMIDEEALRDLIAQVVREELQGALGQRITRNVRKMVRREIRLALAAEDFE